MHRENSVSSIERLATCIEKVIEKIGRTPIPLGDEYRYASLPICVVDAIFSINASYPATQNVVSRLCKRTGWTRFAPSRADRGAGEHMLTDLIALYQDRDSDIARLKRDPKGKLIVPLYEAGHSENVAKALFENRRRTSPVSGILKSEAVLLFSKALVSADINGFDDLAPDRLKLAEAKILRLPGQKSGITFDYFQMVAGDDNLVNPSRMVLRFVAEALGMNAEPQPRQAADLVISAAKELGRKGYEEWTPVHLDYTIWQYQRELDASKQAQ